MIQATQLRRGNTILHNGELFQVVDYTHITPGNWRGMVQTKLRNLRTGSINSDGDTDELTVSQQLDDAPAARMSSGRPCGRRAMSAVGPAYWTRWASRSDRSLPTCVA